MTNGCKGCGLTDCACEPAGGHGLTGETMAFAAGMVASAKRPLLIGLYSPCPQSGKTTAARHLVNRYGFAKLSFAKPIKDAICAMLDNTFAFGETYKDVVIPWLGWTPRQLAQSLGTDWGRNMVDSELWIKIAMNRAGRLMADGRNVVIDDLRFGNEWQAIKAAGGVCVYLSRKGHVVNVDHPSEGQLVGYPFDYVLQNVPDGVANVQAAIDGVMATLDGRG